MVKIYARRAQSLALDVAEQIRRGNRSIVVLAFVRVIVLDAVARLVPGVLGNADSAVFESFSEYGTLDCPQYTRPAEFRGWKVPEVLAGGNHEEIRRWRRKAALEKTALMRPDLLKEF